jgi:hypothetical protein
MILKLIFIPTLFVIVGLVMLGIAMLAPARVEAKQVSNPPHRVHAGPPPSERIRALERLTRGPASIAALQGALADPDPQVSAVAAILLRDCAT